LENSLECFDSLDELCVGLTAQRQIDDYLRCTYFGRRLTADQVSLQSS
jgi:hypothetical protein